jgi:N-acetylneuraminate synthase
MVALRESFPDAVVGLSDHSLSNYPCLGAVALGASVLERHFTCDKSWPGPDIPISMDADELGDLIAGARAIFEARGGDKRVLAEEAPTIAFAYASVVAIADIGAGDTLSERNIWVKRPGTGEIRAERFKELLGRRAKTDIPSDTQIRWEQIL